MILLSLSKRRAGDELNYNLKKIIIKNRGKHPKDDDLFGEKWQAIFIEAVHDLSLLLTRGYGEKSATQLVGNRYRLNARQQKALTRMSVGDQAVKERNAKACSATQLEGQPIAIDGFNLLIWLESALSGAYVLQGKDGVYRDVGGIHGSYKKVHQTEAALLLAGTVLSALKVATVHWYFDTPVSNSGRLKVLLYELATEHDFPWEVSLVYNPDRVLAESSDIVVSSDGWVLDETERWFNLNAYLLETGHFSPRPPILSFEKR